MHAAGQESQQAYRELASGLPGELVIAVAPSPGAGVVVFGEDRPFHAWSTIKVPVLAALLTLVHLEALTPEHQELARLAITESNNPAILDLFVLLEELAGGTPDAVMVIERLFRLSGDQRSRVALAPPPPGAVTAFGQTGWSAADSAMFFSSLAAGRLLRSSETRYVLELMEEIIPEQRWGLGRLHLPTAFKGGWGPESGGECLVRQSGVLLGSRMAVSLVAQPPPGDDSFEVGMRMLDAAVIWVAGLSP